MNDQSESIPRMSYYRTKKVYSRFKARRTEYADIPVLQTLSEESWNEGRFGHQRIEQLLEHSLFSITIIEQTTRFEHITGWAVFSDTPTRLLPPTWPALLQTHLPTKYFSTGNTLFLTAFLSEPATYQSSLQEALTVLFHLHPELDYCLVVTEEQPDCVYDKWFPGWIRYTDGENVLCVSICRKEYVYPGVEIREARGEDVHRVVGWFEGLQEKVKKVVGVDWLEKIVRGSVGSQDTKCLVVQDRREQIRGFLALTTANIDWEYLHHHYQTDIFHRFKKLTPVDRLAAQYADHDVDIGGRTSDDPVYGPRRSAPSFAEPEQKSEQKLSQSSEMFITDLVEELYRGAVIWDEAEGRGTIDLAKEIVEGIVEGVEIPEERGTVEIAKDTVEAIVQGAQETETHQERSTLETAETIVTDLIDATQTAARTTVETAESLLDVAIDEIDFPEDGAGPYGLLGAPSASLHTAASSTMDLLSTARNIVNSLLNDLEPPASLPPAASSFLHVPKVVIPVIGPSASDMDMTADYKDSFDYSASFNVADYAQQLVDGLVKLAESVHSRSELSKRSSTGLTDSIKSLINFLEEQGLKTAEMREQVHSAMDVAGIDAATWRSVENLIDDLEAAGSEIVDDFERNPPLSKGTINNLQILIQRLEEEAKRLVEEDEREFDLRLRPRRFKLSQVPYEFEPQESLPPGTLALHSTNLIDLVRPARLSTSASAADRLVNFGGLPDAVSRMHFAVRTPSTATGPHPEQTPEYTLPQRKPEQPRILDAADEQLERALKQQHGIKDYAEEPLFSSADDLVKVPPVFVARVRQEPGLRYLQRRYNQFYQNPVVGRAWEMEYIAATGPPNAIFLFLFHLDPLLSTYLDDILAHCYHIFSGHDYLLTLLPTTDQSPLLSKLLRIPARLNHFLRDDLYGFHIGGLSRHHDIELSAGSTRDLEEVAAFVERVAEGAVLYQAFREAVHYRTSLDAIKLTTTVFRIDRTIIGFAIHTVETEIDYLVAHYAVEDLIHPPLHPTTGWLRLLQYIINPLFNHFNRYILKEILRFAGGTCWMYRFYPLQVQAERKDTRPCCLEEMLLVRPRKVLKFADGANWRLLPDGLACEPKEAFALYIVNRRLIFDRKKVVPYRIAVIGASDMSLQVTRNMILNPHLHFTNLLLISPHGIPMIDQDEMTLRDFPGSRELFTRRELTQLALPANIRVLFGTAITLDKPLKILYVNDKHRIPVDYLVIGSGQQFLTFDISVDSPWLVKLAEGVCAEACRTARLPPRRFQGACGLLRNYFVVNDAWEAEGVVSRLEALREDGASQGYYVIYGTALEAYTAVTTLLRRSVQPAEILLVDPLPDLPHAQSTFASPQCDSWVKNLLYLNGIIVMRHWTVVAYNDGQGGDCINSVTFWTDEGAFKTYGVRAFFNCTEKEMGPAAYSFINSSYLVMDGKVVVDENFTTGEKWIFAGGSWCKLPRKLYTGGFQFAHVSSREIGDIISMNLFKTVAPGLFSNKISERAENTGLPLFRMPVIEHVELPFGWIYCNIHSPAQPVAGSAHGEPDGRSFQKSVTRRSLSTGNLLDGNLCEIYLDELNNIDQIVCLSQAPIDIQRLVTVHGMQEKWLELVMRFDGGYIKDFFHYLEELWLACVLYDRFPLLCGELRRLLLADQHEGSNQSVLDMVVQCFREQEPAHAPDNAHWEDILRRIRVTGIKFDAVHMIQNFMETHSNDLTMYATKFN